uniref:EF-hand domain-containing protein n=1 Tax=Caenorhabditis japonica TaxID=281687 RepID=A0A8R1HQY7_CAEJA
MRRAAFFRFWRLPKQKIPTQRLIENASSRSVAVLAAAGIGTTIGAYQLISTAKAGILDGNDDDASRHNVHTDHKLTKRELRFLQFASVEYDDVIYMSPMDFIDSLTLDGPRERVYRRVLKEKEVNRILSKTPPFRNGSKQFFRYMDQNGLISYSEYIFLLTLLTKSKAAFRIAFLMFDEDDNGNIDRDEFMLIARMFASKAATLSGTRLVHKSEKEVRKQDTTLLLHLFGLRGNAKLSFDEFQQFYENLQEELMEIEFYEFARGKNNISPVDFARLILRYSIVNLDDYHKYLQRVQERSEDDEHGISLHQWATFSRFLNNLAEFQSAVRLYVNSNVPVSEPEFARAVACTIGKELDPVVVSMIFRIFDENNDGTLSYPEFLAVMSDRLHRGLRGRLEKPWGWRPIKNCIISELSRS